MQIHFRTSHTSSAAIICGVDPSISRRLTDHPYDCTTKCVTSRTPQPRTSFFRSPDCLFTIYRTLLLCHFQTPHSSCIYGSYLQQRLLILWMGQTSKLQTFTYTHFCPSSPLPTLYTTLHLNLPSALSLWGFGGGEGIERQRVRHKPFLSLFVFRRYPLFCWSLRGSWTESTTIIECFFFLPLPYIHTHTSGLIRYWWWVRLWVFGRRKIMTPREACP